MLYDLARRLFGYRKCRVVSGNPSSLISRVPSHAVELSSSELTLLRGFARENSDFEIFLSAK